MYENNITPHGERIRSIRKRRGMSQKELARAAGVSLSWVKKQEQGDGGTPTTETMHKVAVALAVQTSSLISEVRPGAPHPHTAEDWGEVRDALHGRGPQPGAGATAQGITEALDAMRPALAANRYSAVRALLPSLIRDAAGLDADTPGARSRVLNLTAWLLTQTRQWDDAAAAARMSADAARGDQLLKAAAVNTLCWSLLRQGRLAEAQALATAEAEAMEPRFSRASTREVALWGRLLLAANNAAVRDNRPGEAADMLSLARAAASRVGREITPDGSTTRTFGPLTAWMIAAENAAIERQPGQVITIAENLPAIAASFPPGILHPLSASRCRHRLDVANAYVMKRDYPKALEMLQELRAEVPEWLVQQGYAKIVMRDIVKQRRTLTRSMRDLADAIGMPL
jgi:transcriptional regulator with XRE-family HTH domain